MQNKGVCYCKNAKSLDKFAYVQKMLYFCSVLLIQVKKMVSNIKGVRSIILVVIMCAFGSQLVRAAEKQYVQEDYLNSVKITFLSWFSGSTKISYERAFPKINQSGEICSSLICAGYDKYDNNPLGFTVRYGHKFFLADNEKLALRGFYLRPEAIYSYYTYDSQYGGRTEANMGALLATVGYQYVWRRLLVDAWVGGGYAFGKSAETNYHHGFELWHWFGKQNQNIAMSFSIRLGVCF